jgi:hypothetical protein
MKGILDIINNALARYGIEPLSQSDIESVELPPRDMDEIKRSFDALWQKITEIEAAADKAKLA